MKGISISDGTAAGVLALDLRDVLQLLGSDGERSRWTLRWRTPSIR